MNKTEIKRIEKAQKEYNKRYDNLYEILYQDTQWGVEHIMELENRVKNLTTLCDNLEKKLKNK